MMSSSILATASAASIVEANGLAAQFKSIVPADLFLALGLGFLIGLIIALVYRKTYRYHLALQYPYDHSAGWSFLDFRCPMWR